MLVASMTPRRNSRLFAWSRSFPTAWRLLVWRLEHTNQLHLEQHRLRHQENVHVTWCSGPAAVCCTAQSLNVGKSALPTVLSSAYRQNLRAAAALEGGGCRSLVTHLRYGHDRRDVTPCCRRFCTLSSSPTEKVSHVHADQTYHRSHRASSAHPRLGGTTMRRLPPSRMPRMALRIAMGTVASSVIRTVSPTSLLLSCRGRRTARHCFSVRMRQVQLQQAP